MTRERGVVARAGEELVLPDEVVLHGADFRGRRFDYLSIGEGSRLTGCDFRDTWIRDGDLGGGRKPTLYRDCLFDRATLRGVLPGRASFVSCSFRETTLSNFRAHEAEFVDCVFSGRLTHVIFNGRVVDPDPQLGRDRNEFRGNDFRAADLRSVSFRTGIDLDLQLLPTGAEYLLIRDAADVLDRALQAAQDWPEGPARTDALTILDVYRDTARRGQKDLFVRESWLSTEPEVAARIADLIRGLLPQR